MKVLHMNAGAEEGGENTYYFTFISIFKGRSGINGI